MLYAGAYIGMSFFACMHAHEGARLVWVAARAWGDSCTSKPSYGICHKGTRLPTPRRRVL